MGGCGSGARDGTARDAGSSRSAKPTATHPVSTATCAGAPAPSNQATERASSPKAPGGSRRPMNEAGSGSSSGVVDAADHALPTSIVRTAPTPIPGGPRLAERLDVVCELGGVGAHQSAGPEARDSLLPHSSCGSRRGQRAAPGSCERRTGASWSDASIWLDMVASFAVNHATAFVDRRPDSASLVS